MNRNLKARTGISSRGRRAASGFTLIELIVVVTVLAILGVTALPKMLNISSEAKSSALTQIVGNAATAHSLNAAGCTVTNNVVTAGKCVTVNNCSDTASLMQGGQMPAGYTVAAGAISTTNGTEATCTLTQTSTGATATFAGVAAGN